MDFLVGQLGIEEYDEQLRNVFERFWEMTNALCFREKFKKMVELEESIQEYYKVCHKLNLKG